MVDLQGRKLSLGSVSLDKYSIFVGDSLGVSWTGEFNSGESSVSAFSCSHTNSGCSPSNAACTLISSYWSAYTGQHTIPEWIYGTGNVYVCIANAYNSTDYSYSEALHVHPSLAPTFEPTWALHNPTPAPNASWNFEGLGKTELIAMGAIALSYIILLCWARGRKHPSKVTCMPIFVGATSTYANAVFILWAYYQPSGRRWLEDRGFELVPAFVASGTTNLEILFLTWTYCYREWLKEKSVSVRLLSVASMCIYVEVIFVFWVLAWGGWFEEITGWTEEALIKRSAAASIVVLVLLMLCGCRPCFRWVHRTYCREWQPEDEPLVDFLQKGTEVRVHRALGKIHTLGGVVVKIRKRRGVYLYDVRYFEGASKVARSVEKRVAPDRIVVVDEEDIAGSDSGAGSDNPRNDSRMWLQRMCDGSIPVPFDGLELDAFITHNPCGQSYVMRGSFAGNNPLLGRQRQPVAAKVFLDGREYQRELTVMRRLQSDANLGGGHRNVVATIHEFQHPCAVLLFELGSMSLKDAFDLDVTTGVMQERRRMVASYGLDAARGMAFLHESGIAHLDLKPDNVMIFGKGGGRGDDHAKIIDLGLAEAHAAGRDDAEVLVQGTVPYMSPEVHRARRQPVRTDLFKVDAWAMGCVLWATAAGLDPWREMVPDDDGGGVPDDERKAAYQLRVGDAVVGGATPPVDIPDVPSELRPLLASAFQMEAAARPSMGAFVEFLSAFAAAAGSRDGGGGGGGGEAGGGEGLSAPLLG